MDTNVNNEEIPNQSESYMAYDQINPTIVDALRDSTLTQPSNVLEHPELYGIVQHQQTEHLDAKLFPTLFPEVRKVKDLLMRNSPLKNRRQ